MRDKVKVTRIRTEYSATIPIKAEIVIQYEKDEGSLTHTKLRRAFIYLFREDDDTPFGIEAPVSILRGASHEKMNPPMGLVAWFESEMERLMGAD